MADEEMQDQGEHPVELLDEAKNLGWVPLEQFKGDKEKFVDAPEFVELGRKVVPLLRSNNKRLQSDLLQTREKMGTMETELESAKAAIAELVKANTTATRKAAEAAKASLTEQIKEARSENDVEKELELREQLDEANEALKAKPAEVTLKTPAKKQDSALSPEFQEWVKENSWYGGNSPEDKKRTKLAGRIAEDLRDEGVATAGRAFLDLVVERLEEQETPVIGRATSKVEGTNPRARTRNGAKGWNDLPAEAKQACLTFEDSLVGPNKLYKDRAAWQTQYAKDYFAEEG